MPAKQWQHLPRRGLQFLVRHWIFSALVPTVPGWVALGVCYFGEAVPFVTKDGVVTLVAKIVILAVTVLATMFALVKSRAIKFDVTVRTNSEAVLIRLLSSMNAITRFKLERLVDFISVNNRRVINRESLCDIADPKDQIMYILDDLQKTLGELTGIERDGIGISLAYRKDNDWKWLGLVNVRPDDLSASQLACNPTSALHQVMIARKASMIFYPDKSIAAERSEYVFGQADQEDPVGSVLVKRLSIDDDAFPVCLSISTYGKQLCEQTDEEAKVKIRTKVLTPYETRLKLELCLYYLRNVMASGSKKSGRATLIPPRQVSLRGRSGNLIAGMASDVSRDGKGCAVVAQSRFSENDVITVEGVREHVSARVVYCQPYQQQYRLGLAVQSHEDSSRLLAILSP